MQRYNNVWATEKYNQAHWWVTCTETVTENIFTIQLSPFAFSFPTIFIPPLRTTGLQNSPNGCLVPVDDFITSCCVSLLKDSPLFRRRRRNWWKSAVYIFTQIEIAPSITTGGGGGRARRVDCAECFCMSSKKSRVSTETRKKKSIAWRCITPTLFDRGVSKKKKKTVTI